MRIMLAALALLAVLSGCRSTLAPEPAVAPYRAALRVQETLRQGTPDVPRLHGLRAYAKGDSVIIEASLHPRSPLSAPWGLGVAFHEGDPRREVGFSIPQWTVVSQTTIHEAWDGVIVGRATYWRNERRFRIAATLSDPNYSLSGTAIVMIPSPVFPTPAEQIYRVTVRERGHGPHGEGRLAAE